MRSSFEYLPQEKKLISVTWEDGDTIESIIENNKRLQTIPQKSDWSRHVACIPNWVSQKWLDEERNRGHFVQWLSEEFNELCDRKLKDPEWKWLRTDAPSQQMGWRNS